MAEGGNPSYTKRLKHDIKKNEKRIKELEDQVQKLQADLKDHNENCVGEMRALKDEIERLKNENSSMHKKLDKDLTNEIDNNKCLHEMLETTKEELKTTKQKLKDHDQRIKGFELSEDQICIAQLRTSLQKNMCKIVLREKFTENLNHNPKYMYNHISKRIEGKHEKRAARRRWETLKREIGWDPYLITTLKPIINERNKYTHRTPTEKSIKDAKDNLEKKGKLDEEMSKAVDSLTKMLKQTNDKLTGGRQSVTEPDKHVQESEERCLQFTVVVNYESEKSQYSKVSGGSDLRKTQAAKQ